MSYNAAVAELGSVFEDEEEDSPRGPDLRVSVEVPRVALGASLRAPVPPRIAAEGDLVERAVTDGADPNSVELHLPEELAPRTMLRLRGQGGVHPEGRPGDLLVLVELVDRAPRADEVITRPSSALAPSPGNALDPDGRDITLWILLGLALLAGGGIALYALL